MQLLASCNLFQGLSETQLQRLADITKEMKIEKGEWLFQEGQEANGLFILKEGAVELLTKVDDEFELPIAMLREPGTEQGSLLVIERTELEKLIQEDRELGYIIMTNWAEHLLNRLKETRQELKIHFKTLFKSMHS